MSFVDLRAFLDDLERRGELKRIKRRVSPELEVTEISRRVIEAGGPVGDDHQGASRRRLEQGFYQTLLGRRIQPFGRLIQNRDRRVAQQGARDGDAAYLAAGKLGSGLTHIGVVAGGQRRDLVVDLRHRAGGGKRRVVGVGIGQPQVLPHRGVEQMRTLRRQGDHVAHRFRPVAPQFMPAQGDASRLIFPQTQQRAGHRALAGGDAAGQSKISFGVAHGFETEAASCRANSKSPAPLSMRRRRRADAAPARRAPLGDPAPQSGSLRANYGITTG